MDLSSLDRVRTTKDTCILIPYFGPWPEWTELFFESCRWNPCIDWIILNDQPGTVAIYPPNVKIIPFYLPDLITKARRTLDIDITWKHPYKICDLRLAFGHLFEDLIADYIFFGWSDIDVIYGNIASHLTNGVLDHDFISFCDTHVNGHLCIVRNTKEARYSYRELPYWRERMKSQAYTHFDELAPTDLPSFLRVYCKESFNTPLSPYNRWTDGTFDFPKEWYWREGVLTNNKDGERDFIYLHFMHWKGGWWPRQCGNAHWEKLDRLVHLRPGECRTGFRINERGFYPLSSSSAKPEAAGQTINVLDEH